MEKLNDCESLLEDTALAEDFILRMNKEHLVEPFVITKEVDYISLAQKLYNDSKMAWLLRACNPFNEDELDIGDTIYYIPYNKLYKIL
jgi:hypothetical protein